MKLHFVSKPIFFFFKSDTWYDFSKTSSSSTFEKLALQKEFIKQISNQIAFYSISNPINQKILSQNITLNETLLSPTFYLRIWIKNFRKKKSVSCCCDFSKYKVFFQCRLCTQKINEIESVKIEYWICVEIQFSRKSNKCLFLTFVLRIRFSVGLAKKIPITIDEVIEFLYVFHQLNCCKIFCQ